MENQNNELEQNNGEFTEAFSNAVNNHHLQSQFDEVTSFTQDHHFENKVAPNLEAPKVTEFKTDYEENANNFHRKSKNSEVIKAEKSQKLIARRAFIKGALTATGVAATVAAGIEASHKLGEVVDANKKSIEALAKANQDLNTYYPLAKEYFYEVYKTNSINDFIDFTREGGLSSIDTDYLIYRFANEYLISQEDFFADRNTKHQESITHINAFKNEIDENAYPGITEEESRIKIYVDQNGFGDHIEKYKNSLEAEQTASEGVSR